MSANTRCKECNKTFSRPTTLRRHIQAKHSQDAPSIPCEHCHETFSRKEYLLRHQSSQHGNGKQACSICSRTFRSDHLAKHLPLCAVKAQKHLKKTPLIRSPPASSEEQRAFQGASRLRWRPPVETKNHISAPSAAVPTDSLRMAPSLYSSELRQKREILGRARRAAIASDQAEFDKVVLDLSSIESSVKDLEAWARDCRRPGEPYAPLIVLAAQNDSLDIIRILARCGTDAQEPDSLGQEALNYAREPNTIRALVGAGADASKRSCQASINRLLRKAVATRDLHRAAALIGCGAKPSQEFVCACAIRAREDKAFLLLLQARSDWDDSDCRAMLRESIQHGTLFMVDQLLAMGIKVNNAS